MLRFCMITTFYPPYSFGGDATFVQALGRGLVERGHSVDVVHCVDSYRALAPASATPEGAADGATVHALRSPLGILSPLATHQIGYPLLKSGRIRRILASKPFDVIHFHNVSLVGGPAVLRYGSAVKLYTIHEHWLLCPMHTLFRDNKEVCTDKRCVRCSLRYRRPPQWWRYSGLLRRSVPAVDAFIAPTEFTRRIHEASALPIEVRVIGHFHRADVEPAFARVPGRPFFLYAGRLERLKGVHDLLEVFRDYRDADLLVAGDGAERRRLEEMARGYDHVRFLGKVARAELTGLFARAIAALVPSVGYEVFPLVMLEAFAAGAPVIARNRGSLAEIVQASGGGLLFDDVAGLRGALRRLQSTPALRDSLGAKGHAAWRANWTVQAHLDRYLALVDEIRARKPSAA